ncbi:class I SAM-dependent methyltransferase [Telmatospirillum siberiense]|uniref:SAM-dependent methyltransferase n=1 Tax=Telmatospirillum siberiense TaxID=382514 RepID=A0A2N3PZ77_9PROT|nr:class I SAM-dependent methyltransferase [Telmatospirillum siberiense]PKU25713.1 SAM-dependent methyltransferase [Telmatospirillum siberiense]
MGNEASHQAIVGQQFGQRANAYLTSQVHAEGGDLDELVRLAAGHRPASALDLGCGGGHVAYRLASLVGEMHASDLSEAMVATVSAEAKRRGLDNVIAERAAVERLPYADRTFDMVVTRYSAHHWHDFSAGLSQARRVLKPDGLAVFIDVVSPGNPLLDTWFQTLELLRDPSHVYNRSEAEWREAVETAGFRPDGVSHFKLRLDFASWIGRMRTPDAHVAAIRSLQALAAREVVEHFQFEADGSFTIDSMLLVARPA